MIRGIPSSDSDKPPRQPEGLGFESHADALAVPAGPPVHTVVHKSAKFQVRLTRAERPGAAGGGSQSADESLGIPKQLHWSNGSLQVCPHRSSAESARFASANLRPIS